MILTVCIVFSLALASRLAFFLLFPNDIPFDSYGHLFLYQEKRKQRSSFWLPIVTDRFGGPEISYSHPYLFHRLLAILPDKVVNRRYPLLNPIVDSLVAAGLYLGAAALLPIEYPVVASIIYIFTPLFGSAKSIGPRACHFTPRLFGELCVNLYFVAVFGIVAGGFSWPLALVATGSAYATIASSKFSSQALVMVSAVSALLVQSFHPILFLVLGSVLALIHGRGEMVGMVAKHVQHLRSYYRKNLAGQTGISHRNDWKRLSDSLLRFDLKQLCVEVMGDNTYFTLIARCPLVVLIIPTLHSWMLGSVTTILDGVMAAWFCGGLFCFFFTSIRRFLFLGESERYITHAAIPVVWLGSLLIGNSIWMVSSILIYGLVFQLFELFLWKRKRAREPDDVQSLMAWLKSLKETHLIACFPVYAGGGWRILAESQHSWLYSVVWDDDSKVRAVPFQGHNWSEWSFEKLDGLREEFNISLAIADRRAVGNELGLISKCRGWKEVDLGSRNLVVFLADSEGA